jgi:nuclear transport factor 2 (NTF2) superfamily protein
MLRERERRVPEKGELQMDRPPLPPFNAETAVRKVRLAEDLWNTRNPAHVVLAYSPDGHWRNRAEFLRGREQMQAFLTRKWSRELDYRLIKEIWTFRENRIAVRFAYEFHAGSVPTDMRIGITMSTGLPAFELQASTIFRSRKTTVSIIGLLVADQTAIRA